MVLELTWSSFQGINTKIRLFGELGLVSSEAKTFPLKQRVLQGVLLLTHSVAVSNLQGHDHHWVTLQFTVVWRECDLFY